MILPIVAYGDQVLKKKQWILIKIFLNEALINNMFDTMYEANGVGLAAPQVGKSIRLFIVDASPFPEDKEAGLKDFVQVFINPIIMEESGDEWSFNEGCLKYPNGARRCYA